MSGTLGTSGGIFGAVDGSGGRFVITTTGCDIEQMSKLARAPGTRLSPTVQVLAKPIH